MKGRLAFRWCSIASLASLALAIACKTVAPTPAPPATASSAAATAATATARGGAVGARIPKNHRAASSTCTEARAPLTPGAPTGGSGPSCKTDADCKDGKNGRCGPMGRRWGCSYDDCFVDTDCPAGNACECRGAGASEANTCKAGNCRTDADCNGNYCSPSLSNCGHLFGTFGYFCHSRKDECTDDSDCGGVAGACRYIGQGGYFKCSTQECDG